VHESFEFWFPWLAINSANLRLAPTAFSAAIFNRSAYFHSGARQFPEMPGRPASRGIREFFHVT